MSFFVSDNLKGIVTEEDIVGDNNIRSTPLLLVKHDNEYKFEVLLGVVKDKTGKFTLDVTDNLNDILGLNKQKVSYMINVGSKEYLQNDGYLRVSSFKQCQKDNLITCKIFIAKEV